MKFIFKLFLIICGILAIFLIVLIMYFSLSNNYFIAKIKHQLFSNLSANNVQPSQNWKSYNLSNITFQIPDDYNVSIYDGTQTEGGSWRAVIYTTSEDTVNRVGAMGIDSKPHWLQVYKNLEEAKKYYQSNRNIRLYKFEERDKMILAVGQRDSGVLGAWDDFEERVIDVGGQPIMIWTSTHNKSVSPEALEKIIQSIKPLD